MQEEQNALDRVSRDTIARGLLIAQTKRELLAHLKQYQVGFCVDSQILMSKNIETLDGVLFIIPKSEYMELFKEKK